MTRPIVLREVFLIVIWSGLTIYWWLYPRIIESRRELLSTHQAADATA
ncbi:hypothetical protein [Mycolicibacterium fortuitum]|uniref:Uncharacterized protein n=1 Tax=Mycolicibacterium fortuitum TaxID=1766 RepID=A0AAE5AFE1_MYCFO|nr:hypothetical protein [Mycolicibacterium fortuitum]MCV7137954.1 hypothetical protein [Mycolicibacterium fortuitum]MDV7194521.1 hypothetical protein [Mycolicibacterium fortuitum]MDV7207850.1 hypothetical protein [Mycolicibacterium fortuitum]MDV7229147.1 hypothetical protein [Mycolicibacterium fortuitum]MDV7260847.1 hypothetical protein [Mycolicibacterium fortuitum]